MITRKLFSYLRCFVSIAHIHLLWNILNVRATGEVPARDVLKWRGLGPRTTNYISTLLNSIVHSATSFQARRARISERARQNYSVYAEAMLRDRRWTPHGADLGETLTPCVRVNVKKELRRDRGLPPCVAFGGLAL